MKLVRFSVNRPLATVLAWTVAAFVLMATAALPSIFPQKFPFLNGIRVDTDPENMLRQDEPVRVFHNRMKKEMNIYDILVVGVTEEENPDGVFNIQTLQDIYDLAEYAKGLRWDEGGVVSVDIISPSTVDSLTPGKANSVVFEWLMSSPPRTREEALEIRRKAMRVPFLNGTMVSEDGKALCLYLPLTSKKVSYRVAQALKEKIATFKGKEEFYITGLPVAEDTFGVEMFRQMAISAPLAMLVIFLMMLWFFRKLSLIISPLIVAMISVACTMSLLVISGNTIHIMSSMIPIFLMPIAVLDAVHILSEFFDRYQETRDRKTTILHVMDELFVPMLYTSLTTGVGFASLALTPIPPVQVFGLFVAFGVMVAWVATITFIPAYVMFIRPESLKNYGLKESGGDQTLLMRVLAAVGSLSYRRAKAVIISIAILGMVAAYGISKININDNPIRWFTPSHPIRIADRVLNEHFGGTYMAYLSFFTPSDEPVDSFAAELKKKITEKASSLKKEDVEGVEKATELVLAGVNRLLPTAKTPRELLDKLSQLMEEKSEHIPDELSDAWDEFILFIDEQKGRLEIFKRPEVLGYLDRVEQVLLQTGIVGKVNSLATIVKTINRDLHGGKESFFRLPPTSEGVANCLMQFQNSHRIQDLWRMVTPDFRKAVLWVQLKSGDNRDMSRVAAVLDDFIRKNPPPVPLKHEWFGLTYINVVWQEKMVTGMLQAFLGSFLVVFLMMIFLYRSALWALLSMIPLTVTIALVYGIIGLVGKDYDMPVAVLSSLSLGLAVDYAIHFVSRSRHLYALSGRDWGVTVSKVFGEPARAIARNVFVVGIGFLPLIAAPLVPYQTVGVLIASILIAAGVATLVILPATITLLRYYLFECATEHPVLCRCNTCILTAAVAATAIAVNVNQFLQPSTNKLVLWTLITLVVSMAGCFALSRHRVCQQYFDGPNCSIGGES